MNAVVTANPPAPVSVAGSRPRAISALRGILLLEAALGLAGTIFLSMLASALASFLGGESGREAEEMVRFAAGGVIIFAIAAAATARGVRRARGWSWTSAALLQLALASGSAVLLAVTPWALAAFGGFVLAAVSMLLLSAPSVRRALGQV